MYTLLPSLLLYILVTFRSFPMWTTNNLKEWKTAQEGLVILVNQNVKVQADFIKNPLTKCSWLLKQ